MTAIDDRGAEFCLRAADLLSVEKENIVATWEKLARKFIPGAKHQTHYLLADSLPQLVDECILSLRNEQTRKDSVAEISKSHAFQRSRIDEYDLEQVLKEYELFSHVVLEAIKKQQIEAPLIYSIVSEFVQQGKVVSAKTFTDIFLAKQRKRLEELRSAEEKLSESQKRFGILFDKAPVGIAEVDPRTRQFIQVNGRFCEMLGYSAAELLQMRTEDITLEEDEREDEIAAQKIFAGELDYFRREKRYRRKSGEVMWAELNVSVNRGRNGESLANIAVVQDITERKIAEESLAKAHTSINNFKLALDSSSIVATTDAKGVIIYVNDKFCEISQFSREELIGKTHKIVNSGFHPMTFFADLWNTISSGRVWRGELKNRAKDDSFYWVDTVIVPFMGAHGQPEEYISIQNDITKRKLAFEQLREERIVRERFVSTLTHDLRAPLTTAKMNTQLAARKAHEPDRVISLCSRTNEALNRLDTMIRDLLDVSQMRAGKSLVVSFKPCNVSHLVREVVEELTASYGVPFKVDISEELVGFWSCKELRRALENLGSNAVKYGDTSRPISIHVRSEKSWAVLSVHNYGTPISEKDLPFIFDTFLRSANSQGRAKGWGLGLSLVKGVAEAHHGRVDATSTLSEGTCFSLRLPLDPRLECPAKQDLGLENTPA